ncbi:poly(ADP-ribose) glycohydrolase-like isoform X2 [Homalodisca vitripennis]|uniref:poly(ADP-ribose) glycohydrolase-like isoform X2 n=1 Tax=Homalodisca vitripennis TaxID=197043 RepID=UPI001EEC7FC1|nr:poly(ADP-ribose) glycohydrolase-like isoform X2 [Homalodisca vitripennis]XP_046667272.1 poly(ADP-ribose) glycohydrolase-like isoform X2 [Homalodisca vitripennis]XP_046667273.1 poly(ADP-ribose) glycohydrolase-like isoform X2 [Homalodisca vitripennis]XP_046667274.1 poly(ADP-ribose) glycohydrolase-like isoform X2 [Homalodisca vitripennis]XP_046667275.1 poly(ADP-ribose) glycohydrolase-like isoform X2 [Homalodisca vitripennis]XP_046667276.1 poly(ADP-ribose) glycohydrolase-like isoform X2 [Homalo
MEIEEPLSCDISMVVSESDDDIIFANSQEDITLIKDDSATSSNTEAHCSRTEINNSSDKNETSHTEIPWRGTPLHKLVKTTGKDVYPPVAVSPQHTVLFKLPVKEGQVPKPWPEKPQDNWDQNHVRMPHSASNLYPVTPTELRSRWELVQQALSSPISNSQQLEAAILHYNSKYSDRWDFRALHSFFSTALEEVETEHFFAKVLPKVVKLALSLPTLLTQGVPLLKQHVSHSISLTQQQISCLLANAFLCTFPCRNTDKKDSEYSTYPSINFNRLFTAGNKGRLPPLHEKLKCLINYFRRVTTKVPEGVVTYSRHYVPPGELPDWSKATNRLPNMYVSSTGTIEDEGTNMLQVDFADRFIGGLVFGRGCVQEEIRFVICPELLLARLFTEVLDDTEAIIISGCERFSTYQGYSNTFEWTGNVEDSTPRDSGGRRLCTVLAIDATRFQSGKTQYSEAHISRDLNKAYAGFSWGVASGSWESIATGNWGCGAYRGDANLKTLLQLMAAAVTGRDMAYFTFGNTKLRDRLADMHSFLVKHQVTVGKYWDCGAYRGDANLKTLLQLMAAAVTGRDMAYFTFGNTELRDKLADMHSFLVKHQVTVGDLWKIITSYIPALYRHSLYDHIYSTVTNGSVPVPFKGVNHPAFKKQRVLDSSRGSGIKKETMRQSEGKKESPSEKQAVKVNNNHKLSSEEIEKALDNIENGEECTEETKPLEAKTLSIKSDKELCLKRLSSSWTNLNDSKKDFGSSEQSVRTEQSSETLQGSSSGTARQSQKTNQKKKISDYFQSVSKS